MSNYKKLTAAALAAFAIAISLGSGQAAAHAPCDGSWHNGGARGYDPRTGTIRQAQCYYLPTVSNGRVTGLEFKENARWVPVAGASIGPVKPPHYR